MIFKLKWIDFRQNLDIVDCQLSITTLEEVFLTIAENSEEAIKMVEFQIENSDRKLDEISNSENVKKVKKIPMVEMEVEDDQDSNQTR